jgi:hypothetical protein
VRRINRYSLLAAVLLAVVFSSCDLNISFGDSPSSSAAASFSASSAPAPKLAERPKEEKAESSSEAEEDSSEDTEKVESSSSGENSEGFDDFPIFDPWDYEFEPYEYDTGSPWTDYEPLKDN